MTAAGLPAPTEHDVRAAAEAIVRAFARSSDARMQTFPGGAVFTHTVHTTVDTAEGPESSIERETIVFRTTDAGRLVAVHEHLSPQP